jgi:hypothetical protein
VPKTASMLKYSDRAACGRAFGETWYHSFPHVVGYWKGVVNAGYWPEYGPRMSCRAEVITAALSIPDIL